MNITPSNSLTSSYSLGLPESQKNPAPAKKTDAGAKSSKTIEILKVTGKVAVIASIALLAIGSVAMAIAGGAGLLGFALPVVVWIAFGAGGFLLNGTIAGLAGYLLFGIKSKSSSSEGISKQATSVIKQKELELEEKKTELKEALTIQQGLIEEQKKAQSELLSHKKKNEALQEEILETKKKVEKLTYDSEYLTKVKDGEIQKLEKNKKILEKEVQGAKQEVVSLHKEVQDKSHEVEKCLNMIQKLSQENYIFEQKKKQLEEQSEQLKSLKIELEQSKKQLALEKQKAQQLLKEKQEIEKKLPPRGCMEELLITLDIAQKHEEQLVSQNKELQLNAKKQAAHVKELQLQLKKLQLEVQSLRSKALEEMPKEKPTVEKVLQTKSDTSLIEKRQQHLQEYAKECETLNCKVLEDTLQEEQFKGRMRLKYSPMAKNGIPLVLQSYVETINQSLQKALSNLDPKSKIFDKDFEGVQKQVSLDQFHLREELIWKMYVNEYENAKAVLQKSGGMIGKTLSALKEKLIELNPSTSPPSVNFQPAIDTLQFHIDQLHHAAELLGYLETYEGTVISAAATKYQMKLSPDSIVTASEGLLMKILGENTIETLLTLSPENYSIKKQGWPDPKVLDPETDDLLKLWKHWLVKSKNSSLEDQVYKLDAKEISKKLMSAFKNDKNMAKVIEDFCLNGDADFDQAVKKAKTVADLRRHIVKRVNNGSKKEIKDYIKEKLGYSEEKAEQLVNDSSFIPLPYQKNIDLISDETISNCFKTVDLIKKAEILSQDLFFAQYSEKTLEGFENIIQYLPKSARKSAVRNIYEAQNTMLIGEAVWNLKASNKKNKLQEMLQGKSPLWKKLNELGINPGSVTLDPSLLTGSLDQMMDERWVSKVPPNRMKKMIDEAFERHLLNAPEVRKSLLALREDDHLRNMLYKKLSSEQFAKVCAVALIELGEGTEEPQEAQEKLHRILATMLAGSKDIGKNLLEAKQYVWVIPSSKYLTDLPPLKYLEDVKTEAEKGSRPWKYVRGVSSSTCVALSEENLLGKKCKAPGVKGVYDTGYSVAVHEVMHHIYKYGMASGKTGKGTSMTALKTEIEELFASKEKKIKTATAIGTLCQGWKYSTGETQSCSYAATDKDEWCAEFATAFFEANGVNQLDKFSKNKIKVSRGQIKTREKLRKLGAEEKRMSEIYEDLFGVNSYLPYCNPIKMG